MRVGRKTSIRRAAAGVAAATVVGGLALAQPASAVTDTTTQRLDGANRYETAVAVADDSFPDGADTVIVATGEDFADALAASGIAGALGAPVLLTQTDTLTPATAAAIDDLDPTQILLMGGTAAISQAVEDALDLDYDVSRIQGANRFETANAAADAISATAAGTPLTPEGGIGETSDGVTAFVTNGRRFPDAVSASPVAYAGSLPVLLSEAATLPQPTSAAITDNGIEHVVIVGGTTVVSAEVQAALEDLGVTTERLAGPNRFATNVAAVNYGIAEVDFDATTTYLATGALFPDALVSGPAAGANGSPLVLVNPTAIPDATNAFLLANAGTIDDLVAIGGTAAISDATLAAAATVTKLTSNQILTVAPTESLSLPISGNLLNSDGARTYTASGLEPGTTYDIGLVDPAVITFQGGVARFSAYTLSDDASTSIEAVNGIPTLMAAGSGFESVSAEGDATAEGTLTFTVDATEVDRIIPVVFLDGDTNDALTLTGTTSEEPFGIGGLTTWVPEEAANGNAGGVTVELVDRLANLFTTTGGDTYFYEPGDVLLFESGADERTPSLVQFEGLLSEGDVLDVEYQRDAQSLFRVTTDDIPDITDLDATSPRIVSNANDDDVVTVTFEPADQIDVTYRVFRDTDQDGVLDDAEDDTAVATTSSGTATFNEGGGPTSAYIVVPTAGFSGAVGEPDGAPTAFTTPELRTGQGFVAQTEGATVVTNAGISTANQDDVWLLSFTKDVQVSATAAITVSSNGGVATTIRNGSDSTWSTDGRSVEITLGAATNDDGLTYSNLVITGLTGVSDAGGTAFSFSPTTMPDRTLELGGPELMGLTSSTCNAGDTECTLTFNEPVDAMTASATTSYATPGGGPGVTGAGLLDDGRTVQLTFGGALEAGDQVGPGGALLAPGVDDAAGQESTQEPFAFVLVLG